MKIILNIDSEIILNKTQNKITNDLTNYFKNFSSTLFDELYKNEDLKTKEVLDQLEIKVTFSPSDKKE